MSNPVPGSAIIQMAIDHAWRAQQATIKGNQNEALLHLANSIQQLAGGLKDALQAIYNEVD